MSHKYGLASKYSFKMAASKVEFWASFDTNFFRIASTLEAETCSAAFFADAGDCEKQHKHSSVQGVLYLLHLRYFSS